MSCTKKEIYGVLGPPRSQPRKLQFIPESGRRGRGEKLCSSSLQNLLLNTEKENGDICSTKDSNGPHENVDNIGILEILK